MSVVITLSSDGSGPHQFTERIFSLSSGESISVGRADTGHRSDLENGYFNSKVLSKKHAKIIHKGGTVFLQDLGSTNGRPSKLREISSGDQVQFGTEVTEIQPVRASVTITDQDGVLLSKRNSCSFAFTPAESQEDVTVNSEHSDSSQNDDSNEQDCLSRESMMVLREKLLEMQRGMEFLSVKERDYEELSLLAEEEAETICKLEKENYKLKIALNNIETRISHEKDKYMKLAEIEAETICNLEKENFKLNDALNLAEEKFRKERETNRNLENELRKSREMQEKLDKSQELIDLKEQLSSAQEFISVLQKENEELRVEERFNEATESDQDLIETELKDREKDLMESQLTGADRPQQRLTQLHMTDVLVLVMIVMIALLVGHCL